MSSCQKFNCKWTFWQVFIRVYRLEIQSVMLVFSSCKEFTCKLTFWQVFIRVYTTRDTFSHVGIFDPALWTVAPLTFSLVQFWRVEPPSLCHSVYRQCVAGRGWVYWVLLETIFCRSLTLCIWPDSEPTKLPDHPKQKPRRGEGLRQICKHLPQSLFIGQIFWMTTFCFGVYIVN